MKKILTLLTGIAFVITILLAGACEKAVPPPARGPKTVKITLKAVEINGEMHLRMHNSYKPRHKVIDTLETLVNPGDSVVWKLKLINSGIEEIDKISPLAAGKIMKKDAGNIPGTKKFGLKIPDNAPQPSPREKYDIEFLDRDGNSWPIDPYLRIPRKQQQQ